MNYRALAAEFLGTFTLALVVSLSVSLTLALSTPAIAALTLGLFVYTVGAVSGAHLNPAVTLGLLSIEKIKLTDALLYLVAQFVGAAFAMILFTYLQGSPLRLTPDETLHAGIGEAIGAFILLFGIVAVVRKNVPSQASGLVIGGSLLLGIFAASGFGNGIVNPAVAWAIGSFTPMYILGPVVGAVAGAWAYRLLAE